MLCFINFIGAMTSEKNSFGKVRRVRRKRKTLGTQIIKEKKSFFFILILLFSFFSFVMVSRDYLCLGAIFYSIYL